MTIRFRVTLASGRIVEGPIQGNGGKLGGGSMHAGHGRARAAAIRSLDAALRAAHDGRDIGIFEPRPGHAAIYPDYCAESDGIYEPIPLEGLVYEVPFGNGKLRELPAGVGGGDHE